MNRIILKIKTLFPAVGVLNSDKANWRTSKRRRLVSRPTANRPGILHKYKIKYTSIQIAVGQRPDGGNKDSC